MFRASCAPVASAGRYVSTTWVKTENREHVAFFEQKAAEDGFQLPRETKGAAAVQRVGNGLRPSGVRAIPGGVTAYLAE